MVGDTVLNQDFREFIQSLNDNGVRYLVIGGYAVAFHGHPRYTKDMAVWIAMDAENAANMSRLWNNSALRRWVSRQQIFSRQTRSSS